MNHLEPLPAGWRICRIADAGEATIGQQKSPLASRAVNQLPYLRVANVLDDQLALTDVATMGFDPNTRSRYRLDAGDVLLCEGQSRELVGRCAMYMGELEEVYFQNHLIRFRAHEHVLPEYALLVFRGYQRVGIFSSISTSTTNIANLGLRRFTQLPFPLPPRHVQRAIVDLGRAVQNEIDASRETLRVVSETIATLPRSARDLLIIGGEAIGSIGRPTPVQPGEWILAADAVPADAPIVYGIRQPGADIPDASGVPYIRGKDLREGEILVAQLRRTSEAIANANLRSAVAPGDVLLGIIRHTRVAIVPPELDGANITQGTARVRPAEELDSGFLAHWLASGAAQAWLHSRMRGIAMPGLNLRDVRQLPVPLISLSDQREIARQLDAAIAQITAVDDRVTHAAINLTAFESSFLPSVAYGEIANLLTRSLPAARLYDGDIATKAPRKGRKVSKVLDSNHGKRRQGLTATEERVLDDNDLFQVLLMLGGSATPEDLFTALEVPDDATDLFYSNLRSLVQAGRVEVRRPDETAVIVQVA